MFNRKYVLKMCMTPYSFSYLTQVLHNSLQAVQHRFQKRHMVFDFHSRKKQYHGRKLVGYSCEQMFDVVSDVENYTHFLPFCKKSYIVSRKSEHIEAALEIGFPPIFESYTSHVTLVKPHLVRAMCVDGRLFSYMLTNWKFNPGLKSNQYSCIVDFSIDFEFKSLLHSNLAHMFFDKIVKQMEGAFLVEARRRYGKAAHPAHRLTARKS